MKTDIMLIDISMLREARKVKCVPCELYDLCDFLAEIMPNQITPIGLTSFVAAVIEKLLGDNEEFNGKKFSLKLKNEKYRLAIYMNYFPLIVDELASEDFLY